jgi:hypothetical protein
VFVQFLKREKKNDGTADKIYLNTANDDEEKKADQSETEKKNGFRYPYIKTLPVLV